MRIKQIIQEFKEEIQNLCGSHLNSVIAGAQLRHCEERSDEAIPPVANREIASPLWGSR